MNILRCVMYHILVMTPMACVCLAQGTTESTRVFVSEELIGDRKFPTGTEVLFIDGKPIEAFIHATVKWDNIALPAETRVIFRKGRAAWLIVPNSKTATILGNASVGTITPIPNVGDSNAEPTQGPVSSTIPTNQECDDTRGWLTPVAMSSFPAPKVLAALSVAEVLGAEAATSSPSQRLITTSKDFTSSEFHIPARSIISTTPDGRNVKRFYNYAKARLFRIELPSHSLVWFEGSIALVLSPQDIDVNGYHVPAGFITPIDGEGNSPFLRLSQQTSLATEFVVPAGSSVSFQAGSPFFVRLSGPATFRGLRVNAGRVICLSPALDGWAANVPLADDSSYEGMVFPGGSNLIITSEGRVLRAVLSRPATFDGLQFFKSSSFNKAIIAFHPNGHVRYGLLTRVTTIKGVTLKAGYVMLFDNGNLESGVLDTDQTIAGVPCLGGTEITLTKNGEPIVFTAAGDYSVANTHLRRGDRFYGTFEVTGETVILDPASLSTTLKDVQNQICDKLAAELLKNSSKFPFGRIGQITKHDFRSSLGADHIDLHQEISVKDMLTNPPFADCDSNIAIDATLKWALIEGFRRPTFKAWISSLGGKISHNFCPGTSALEAVLAIGKALGLINFELQSPTSLNGPLALKDINDDQMAQIIAFLNSLHPEGRVLDWSFKPTSIFIDHQQLKLAYKYSVQRNY